MVKINTNPQQEVFAIKATVHGAVCFARRAEGTKGKYVCVIWNGLAKHAGLFTDEERQVIVQRHPDATAILVGAMQNTEKLTA